MHTMVKLLLVAFAFAYTEAFMEVPVLMWNHGSNLEDMSQYLEPVSAASKVNEYNFKEDYAEKLFNSDLNNNLNSVVIFLQDKLSIEDFTKYGNAYGMRATPPAYQYLKGLITDSDVNSIFLPSVTNAGIILEEMADVNKKWNKITLKPGHYGLDKVTALSKSVQNIIVVYLPALGDDVDQGMRVNDEIVHGVVSRLEENGSQYLAVFTGLKPSHVVEYVHHDRLRRDVDDGDDVPANTTVAKNYKNCTLFYSSKIMFHVLDTAADGKETLIKSVPLSTDNVQLVDDESSCYNSSESTAKLTLKYVDQNAPGGDKLDITMIMEFTVKPDLEWKLSAFNLSYECEIMIDNKTIKMRNPNDTLMVQDWSAPRHYSYHCDSTGNIGGQHVPNANATSSGEGDGEQREESKRKVALEFMGLQVQPTVGGVAQFGRGYDCQVFFTPGILMGIVVGAILTYIFMYGMSMVMNLKTMDRFDDPKGKTITVPTSGTD